VTATAATARAPSGRGRSDDARQRALARYAILDTPADPAFDDVADVARTLIGTSVAGIALLDGERVWFKSHLGLDSPECLRDEFPGGRSAGVESVYEPFTLHGRAFQFFAGAPIVTSEGFHLGDLFVADEHARDLTDREHSGLAALARQVLARLELRRTLMSYHTVVDGVGHVVFQVDDRGRLVSVTPTWSQLTGYGVVRSVGQAFRDFVHPDDRTEVDQRLADMYAEGASPTFECRLLRLMGDDVPVEVIARPLVDEAGRHLGLVGVIADITERKARAVEAQHAQKLEALGRLSAGLAHEINTPMQFVGDNTRFLADSYEAMLKLILVYREVIEKLGDEAPHGGWRGMIAAAEQEADVDFLAQEVPPAVRESLDGVDRVATLVRAMKTFSNPEADDVLKPSDLNEALQAVVTVGLSQLKFVADLVCDFGYVPPVTSNIADLNQVFLNMIMNAADSIEDKGVRGRITISSRSEGEYAVVAIADDGTGIPAQIRQRIFEPFFTTKGVGRGTGQGLALARAVILERHGGTIGVASEVGVGTTFTITLPINGPTIPHT
jgi:PAS domain S-box-containing protein